MELVFEQKVGSGAYGGVWKARDKASRTLAVKFFTAPAEQRNEQVLQHASAMMRVQHPAVARIFSVAELEHPITTERQLAVVMEYIHGSDLLRFNGRISLEQAANFSEQLCEGLAAIHAAGLAHTDLHEGNIILTESQAKIVDIPHEVSLALLGETTRARTKLDDIQDLASILRILADKVPELGDASVDRTFSIAKRTARTPAEVHSCFATLWTAAQPSNTSLTRSFFPASGPVWLAVQAVDRAATLFRTHLVSKDGLLATAAGFYVATGRGLFELVDDEFDVQTVRESFEEEHYDDNSHYEPLPQDFVNTRTSDRKMVLVNGAESVRFFDDEPRPGEQTPLTRYARWTRITGQIGPYVFVERHEAMKGYAAPHGSLNCSFVIVDLDACEKRSLASVFAPEEYAATMRLEGALARESLKVYATDELIFDEVEVELAAIAAKFEGTRGPSLELLFTSMTSYVQSDHRWSSYAVSQALRARTLPLLLSAYSADLSEVLQALQHHPGALLGWSEVPASLISRIQERFVSRSANRGEGG